MIKYQPNAIIIYHHKKLLAELTYFLLPSHHWLLEQLFGSSRTNLVKYHDILLKSFFTKIPHREFSVRILDPLAKSYLRRHPRYQKYIYKS